MTTFRPPRALTAAGALAVCVTAFGFGSILAEPGPISFNRNIRPILSDTCFPCHGPDKNTRRANLRLDLREHAIEDRDGFKVIVPGQPFESELVKRINHTDPGERMPPPDSGRSLTVADRRLLADWIAGGAAYEAHWAFIPPTRPRLPSVTHAGWPANPIDHFILARLESEGLTPAPPAGPERLIRRLSFDLTGLPPTLSEIDTFVSDPSPGAVESLIDRLLARESYGEHMAVAWLDAARYADTNGYNNDTPRFNWRWRDWVIGAFNRNLPFDQFLVEQIAGDLIPDASADQRLATGFNRNHNVTSEGGIIDEEYRLEYVADRVHTTATVFMALSLQCARCHDHKFDPISQGEYYAFSAFFNQVPETGYHKEHVGNPNPVMPAPTDLQRERLDGMSSELDAIAVQIRTRHRIAAAALPDWERQLASAGAPPQRQIPDPTNGGAEDDRSGQENDLPGLLAIEPDQRTDEEWDRLRTHYLYLEDARFAELTRLRAQKQKDLDDFTAALPTAMIMRDQETRRDTFILMRGAYDQPGDKVDPDVPSVFPSFPVGESRNRLGLARWLVNPRHPLTARVAVNRLWHQMFGNGIVETLEDFGSQGAWPTHPELLDWLAIEFVEGGWDVKGLLKIIATSATYQQAASVRSDRLRIDPDNHWLARGPRSRLSAEMIRDQSLSVSGLLTRQLGGPSVKPYQPPGLWSEVIVADDSYSGGAYTPDTGDKRYRRAVYTWWKRTCPPPALNTFDAPDREFCLIRRNPTNTPLQALVLLNDPNFVEAARRLAERVIQEAGASPESRARFAFRLATSRRPRPEELSVLTSAYRAHHTQFSAAPDRAERLVAIGESTPDPTINRAELAAWTTVASMILNLDESIHR